MACSLPINQNSNSCSNKHSANWQSGVVVNPADFADLGIRG